MSKHLRAWRKIFGFTLQEVAAKIGIHYSAIQKWETGVNAVGMPELELLGRAYDIPAFALTVDPVNRATADNLIRACRIVTQADARACDAWLTYGEQALLNSNDDPVPDPKRKKPRRRGDDTAK
jgi:transcriptional regulator with XRE-family HTH domain